MLEEAVQVIRDLLSGKLISHAGPHYTVETARLYSVPDQPPPIYMPASGKAIRPAPEWTRATWVEAPARRVRAPVKCELR